MGSELGKKDPDQVATCQSWPVGRPIEFTLGGRLICSVTERRGLAKQGDHFEAGHVKMDLYRFSSTYRVWFADASLRSLLLSRTPSTVVALHLGRPLSFGCSWPKRKPGLRFP